MALNFTHINSKAPNLISTFILMLIVIILSFINPGDMIEVCSVHVRKIISHMHAYIYGKRYIFQSFLALNSTHIISEVPNLISIFVLMLTVIILSFINSGHMVEVCAVHVMKSISHMHIHLWQTVHISSLALNSTHIISEAPYLIRTFILMLTVIILSFSNWRHG